MDIVIVGAGVSGLATAWTLLGRGHAVTLVERGPAASESSWAGAGILSPLLPWNYPDPVTGLCLRSMRDYEHWLGAAEARAGARAEFWRCGMEVRDARDPDAALAWCATHDFPVERRGAALWLPAVAQARNPRLGATMKAAVLAAGGVLREHCAALGVEFESGSARRLATEHGTLEFDRLVVTTGAWSGLGLPGLAPAPGVKPVRGQILQFQLEPGTLDHIVYRDGTYLVPRQDGLVLVGSTLEDVGFDKHTDTATAARLHARGVELLPALAGLTPVRHWAGLRPGAADNLPLIDGHPEFADLYFNVGHFRYGVTMAPAAAAHLADLIEGRPTALDPAPYAWGAMAARTPLTLP